MTHYPSQPPMAPGPIPPPYLREAPGATASLVLGIITIVFNIPIAGLIMAYIGFQKAREAKAMCEAHPGQFSNAGIAQAGYVICIIGMVLGGLSSLACCAYLGIIGFMLLLAGAGAAGAGGP